MAPTEYSEIFDRQTACDPVLSLEGLTVRFGGIIAVRELSLAIGVHDVVCLIGPNGAGKTTTLNAVSSTVSFTGSMQFDGRQVSRSSAWAMIRAGLGRTFQDPVLIDGSSVVENVLAGAHTRLSYRLHDQLLRDHRVRRLENDYIERAHIILKLLGIDGIATKHAGELSYGARKIVDIARAVIAGPKLVLLDEPTSGLDHRERDMVKSALIALRDAKCVAVLAVEHHMDVVRSVATSVAALEAGSLLLSGPPSNVLDSDELHSAFMTGVLDSAEGPETYSEMG
jgi:branched-chain amino acid transport system ATP-binding protein